MFPFLGDGVLRPIPGGGELIAGPSNYREYLLPGAGSAPFDVGYRTVSITFDDDTWLMLWLLEYLGYMSAGLVTSPADFLAAIYPTLFRHFERAGGSDAMIQDFLDLRGCYNIPTTDIASSIDFLFAADGLPGGAYGTDAVTGGAPQLLWELTCMLVYGYSSDASESTGGTGCVNGATTFSDFVGNTVSRTTPTSPGVGASTPRADCVSVHFLGGELTSASMSATGYECATDGTKDCDAFEDQGCTWPEWDYWMTSPLTWSGDSEWYSTWGQYWVASSNILSASGSAPNVCRTSDGVDTGTTSQGVDSDCGGVGAPFGFGGNWSVNFVAAPFAADAMVMDGILFLARLVHDINRLSVPMTAFTPPTFFLPSGGLTLNPDWQAGRAAATQMASFALRLAANWGYRLIHELGHTYTGGSNHCVDFDCCFELAAQRWLCKVEGRLGMPFCPYSDSDGTDFSSPNEFDANNCYDPSGGSSSNAAVGMRCTLDRPGEVSWSRFTTVEVGSCSAPSTLTTW